jgi:ATP-dependent RNA helicase DDX49/DBP8
LQGCKRRLKIFTLQPDLTYNLTMKDPQPASKKRKLSNDNSDSNLHISTVKDGKDSLAPPAELKAQSVPQNEQEASTFGALGVEPWLISSLGAMAITKPTGIQRTCIPQIIAGKDCIGGSRTGSGKTVAFAVPILQVWAKDPCAIFGVVLTPTR